MQCVRSPTCASVQQVSDERLPCFAGWDNRAIPKGNAFGGGQQASGNARGGQQHSSQVCSLSACLHSELRGCSFLNSPHSMQNVFSSGGAPVHSRHNAFSALAEPSQPARSTQHSISQRVSYPAAQPNAFSTAPPNAFGGSSHRQFQQPQPSPRLHTSGAVGRSANAFSSSSAFGNNAFGNSNSFSNTAFNSNSNDFGGSGPQLRANVGFSSSSNAFSRVTPTPQSLGFGVGLSQQPNNAFAGTVPQQSAFQQPGAQQHPLAFNDNSTGFNAFSSSRTSIAHTGFQNTMTESVMATSNAFSGHTAAPPSKSAFANAPACASVLN
jgi:hypothetical protein